jgi:hypothetical protein
MRSGVSHKKEPPEMSITGNQNAVFRLDLGADLEAPPAAPGLA